jgi:hypothetical protein
MLRQMAHEALHSSALRATAEDSERNPPATSAGRYRD